MFFIDDVMIAEGLLRARFRCDIGNCKGACCVEGEQGGPLTAEEAQWIRENTHDFIEYLDEVCQSLIREKGAVDNTTLTPHTPLNGEGGPCVYLIKDQNGLGRCIFEKLHTEGKIPFQKPVSCHLYPIIFKQTRFYKMLSYERRDVCSSSWNRGSLLVEFERDALERKFGKSFTERLIKKAQKKIAKEL